MNGDPDIIEFLNEALTAELTAINQYFLAAKMLDNWGFDRLADHFRDASIDEMKDAERITDRILYLDGVPNYQRLASVRVGETAMEKLRLALDVETEAIERGMRVGRLRDRIAELREDLCTLRDASDLEVCAAIAALRGMPASFADRGAGGSRSGSWTLSS